MADEIMKLTSENKLDILLHILNTMDEQNVISFAEDKFEVYFEQFSKPLVENYLNSLNNKKTLQFMVYGEPGMMSEHFIKVTSPAKIAREIKLQIDMMKAKHKDMILLINEENKGLKNALESKADEKVRSPEDDDEDRLRMTEKVTEAIDYSKKLSVSLKKNKNLSVLDGVVKDTQGYLQTVKFVSENFDDVTVNLIEPMLEDNRKFMQKLVFVASAAVISISLVAVLLLVFFAY